jgi:hypothetical protein
MSEQKNTENRYAHAVSIDSMGRECNPMGWSAHVGKRFLFIQKTKDS